MGSNTRRNDMRRLIMNLLVFMSFLHAQPGMALAAGSFPGFYGKVNHVSAPASTALPVLLPGSTPTGAKVNDPNGSSLLIEQNRFGAVIDWESFEIGEDASVRFDQQGNRDWSALNRIYSTDPSRIFGSMKADGRIYLINQNGILFGSTSRINTHTLVASSRPISTEDFLAGTIRFIGDGTGVISNHGTIETDDRGVIMLFGSEVENFGTLNAPSGSVVLLAGNKALFTGSEGNYSFNENELDTSRDVTTTFGPVSNYLIRDDAGLQAGGIILADSGQAALYGSVVNQQGLVRSVTALKKAGKIELRASERIITGPGSRTICPISSSQDTGDSSFKPKGSIMLKAGTDANAGSILHQGVITAPGGNIDLSASGRILLDSGSSIDASGVWTEKPAGANILKAQYNSIQLRDDYTQKDGVLKGEDVSFNATTGTSFGDTSGTLNTVDVTAMDQSTAGGTI
ncbi:filamentous hemagglutinin N-terminal domain-containing protein, partial [bacterium]|nr:filamentous hemagglutinin N-terminal domain-containing protein [bacterium]